MTPNHNEIDEPLIKSAKKKPKFTADNDDSENEEQDPESFVSNTLGSKNTGYRDRIDSVKTVRDGRSSEDSDDSFGTDSSGNSILNNSGYDSDLNEQDRALQN